MDQLSPEDLFVHARRYISPLLAPEASAMLHRIQPELSTLAVALNDVFELFIAGHKTYVDSADAFVLLTRDVFSDQYAEHFLQRAAWFDKVSGCEDGLSSTFLQLEPLGALLTRVADGMATAAENAAVVELGLQPLSSERGNPDSSSKEALSNCAITNIELCGTTIRAAWEANPVTKSMEDAATAPIRQDAAWTPEQHSSLAVYHGTVAPQSAGAFFIPLALDMAFFNTAPTPVLRGAASKNQVMPEHPNLAVVWTSFSPLREFLWASFGNEVLSDIPQRTPGMKVVRGYNCPHPRAPAHSHCGVRLLEFRPRLTDSDDQRVFVIPRGVEDQWQRIAGQPVIQESLAVRGSDSTVPFWGMFSRLHGETGGRPWPEVVHCHEPTAKAITSQTWKSAWHGAGIAELGRSQQRIFSISFRCVTPPTSTPVTPTTSDNIRGTPCKKLWNCLWLKQSFGRLKHKGSPDPR